MKYPKLCCLLSVISLTLTAADRVFADQIQASAIMAGDDPGRSDNHTAPSGVITANEAGNFGSSSASASFGSLSVDSVGIRTANGSKRGFTGATAKWTDTFTIQPSNPSLNGMPGSAIVTFHLAGKIAGHLVGFQLGTADYRVVWDSTIQYEGYYQNNDDFAGTPVENLSTFTRTIPFTFGVPTTYDMSLSSSAQMGTGVDPGSASIHLTLSEGSFVVQDNTATPVSYSSISSAGASRASEITNGTSYAGFTLTNSTGHQSALSLLGGTANSNQIVTATFIGNPNTNQLVSDVVDLSGTGTNMFVAQISYDPLAALADFGSEALSVLLWLDPSGKWTNAIAGNSDGGASSQAFQEAFDALKHLKLGNYGVDTNQHVVWAVLDHNSRFAVGKPFDPAAVQWTSLAPQTNTFRLALKGPALGQYMLETNTDLTTTNWGTVRLISLDTNGVTTITDSNSPSSTPQMFYRLRQ